MPDKDPLNYELVTYVWVCGLACWGGLAGYFRKLKSGASRFSVAELIGEMVISSFVGVITFMLTESAEIAPLFAAALIGISGHMGSRAIFLLEKKTSKFFGRDE